jgi:fatty-acyl-CoA synthase
LSGGEKVIPQELEAALVAHPEVAEVIVVGVLDPEWGQQAVAVVARLPATNVSADDLRSFLKRDLAPHKIPRKILFLDVLPVIGPGKIDRVAVQAFAERAGSA